MAPQGPAILTAEERLELLGDFGVDAHAEELSAYPRDIFAPNADRRERQVPSAPGHGQPPAVRDRAFSMLA